MRTLFFLLIYALALGGARGTAEAQSSLPAQQPSMYVRSSKAPPAIRQNDIVLVVVIEHDAATNNAQLTSDRKLEAEMLIDKFIRFSGLRPEPDPREQPEIEFEANKKLKGRGSTDRKDVVHMRIAARVVDVRPNGNLILEARKERRINDERTLITLTGEARSRDVAADYSLPSDRIVDLSLSYTGKGPVSSVAAWTWLTWLIDNLWPF